MNKEDMKLANKFLPKEKIKGHRGYYPACNEQEWDNLPEVFRAMEWFPVEVYNNKQYHCKKEITVAEYVVFDVVYAEPYKIRASVKVHVQDVQKILFCAFNNPQFHLYSISKVVFANGVEWGAKWTQDTKTGAFAVWACDKIVGKQGGYMGFIPCQIEETEEGFKWSGYHDGQNRCHYELLNPFTGR